MNFLKNKSGATSIEYAVIAAGVSILIITGAAIVGEESADNFNEVASKMDSAFNPASGGSAPESTPTGN